MDNIYINVSSEKVENIIKNEICNYLSAYLDEQNIDNSYIINFPLLYYNNEDEKREYDDYVNCFCILIPNHEIILSSINGQDEENLEDYKEDLINDIIYLSKTYKYEKEIGKKRVWKDNIIIENDYKEICDNISKHSIEKKEVIKIQIIKAIITLLNGSINDKVKIEQPSNLLDYVKNNIMLFDVDQTRFLYNDDGKKILKIQGLAGTGKTELLFHKLSNLYSSEDVTIALTCFNKVLAHELFERLRLFFDLMKVSKQIVDEKLRIFHSWGSEGNKNSGLYAYICNCYSLPFERYSSTNNFEDVCRNALDKLKTSDNIEPCFDYIFIDEGQDFGPNFLELCRLVARKQVIVASDLYQNLYSNRKNVMDADYILNKVYRTDPKTFMFSQLLGFGVLEDPVLHWFNRKEEWERMGYTVEIDTNNRYTLSRKPLQRFSKENNNPFEMIYNDFSVNKAPDVSKKIVDIIVKLTKKYPNMDPSDIGIVILSKNNSRLVYNLADCIEHYIKSELDWDSCKGYETKSVNKNNVFISNINNVKGLEFPFIICLPIEGIINSDCSNSYGRNFNIYRNSIYMALTRSFVTSYLILCKENEQLYLKYNDMQNDIKKEGKITLSEPKNIVDDTIVQQNISLNNVISAGIDEALYALEILVSVDEHDEYKEFIEKQIKKKFSDKNLNNESISEIKKKIFEIIKATK